jgi:hypothetical protein
MCPLQNFDEFFLLAIVNNTPRSRSSPDRRRSLLCSLVRNTPRTGSDANTYFPTQNSNAVFPGSQESFDHLVCNLWKGR